MECNDCLLSRAQAKKYESRENEAIIEAAKYRMLWEAAASCISFNENKIKPRGEDEQKIVELAKTANHGPFWSGKTKGWIS